MKDQRDARVILYAEDQNMAGKRLQRAVEMLCPREEVEVHHTLASLDERFHQPMTGNPVFVILTASEEELLALRSVQDALSDRRIILVLPDDESDLLAAAHTFRPRFLSYTNSDFVDVLAVLGKMIGAYPHSDGKGDGERPDPRSASTHSDEVA